jgi:hypothetical protein
MVYLHLLGRCRGYAGLWMSGVRADLFHVNERAGREARGARDRALTMCAVLPQPQAQNPAKDTLLPFSQELLIRLAPGNSWHNVKWTL